MAIQRVDISSMGVEEVANLLGMTYPNNPYGAMNKEGVDSAYGFTIGSNYVLFYYGANLASLKSIEVPTGSNKILSYEKTENTCVFGFNPTISSEERLNFGYTLGTNLATGKKVWIYFVISGSLGYLMLLNNNTAHVVKSALTFEDDEAVSMVNYYIPEFNVFCDYLYSLVTYKNRSDYSYNRFKLNDAYYIKPSGNDISVTAPTTRYDCFAVRVG